jgi:hypothetical protein
LGSLDDVESEWLRLVNRLLFAITGKLDSQKQFGCFNRLREGKEPKRNAPACEGFSKFTRGSIFFKAHPASSQLGLSRCLVICGRFSGAKNKRSFRSGKTLISRDTGGTALHSKESMVAGVSIPTASDGGKSVQSEARRNGNDGRNLILEVRQCLTVEKVAQRQ